MGFFSDLKDDLSQAVNELIPEEMEEAEAVADENEVETSVPTQDVTSGEDISDMLDRVAAMDIPEETGSEETPQDTSSFYMPTLEQPAEDTYRVEEKKSARAALDEVSTITKGMTVQGDLSSEGSLELLGTVIGNINILGKMNVTGAIQGNSKAAEIFADNARITGEVKAEGCIKIGQSSIIIGDISGTSAVIAGAVKGDIDVRGPVILDSSAIVMGNIKSKSVQINNGAVIEGLCSQCYAEVNPTSFFDDISKKGRK